jgi:hypothetical protein
VIERIPGATHVDPSRLRTAPRPLVPEGVVVVLYCSWRNGFASARVDGILYASEKADLVW